MKVDARMFEDAFLLGDGLTKLSFSELVERLPDELFVSTKSAALPFLWYWRHLSSRLGEFASYGTCSGIEKAEARFQYHVTTGIPGAAATCVPLLLIKPTQVISVVPVWNEDLLGVPDWLKGGVPAVRRACLEQWLAEIEKATGHPPAGTRPTDLPYSLVEQAAAVARIGPKLYPKVWVVLFVDRRSAKTRVKAFEAKMERMARWLTPHRGISFQLTAAHLDLRPGFAKVQKATRASSSGRRVELNRQVLVEGGLFYSWSSQWVHIRHRDPMPAELVEMLLG